MRIVPFVVALLLSAGSVQAAETCKANADDKKLSGAARTSFLTKCEKDLDGGMRDDGGGAQACRCSSDKLRHEVCKRRGGDVAAFGAYSSLTLSRAPARHSHGGTNCPLHMPARRRCARSSAGTYCSLYRRNASAHPSPVIQDDKSSLSARTPRLCGRSDPGPWARTSPQRR